MLIDDTENDHLPQFDASKQRVFTQVGLAAPQQQQGQGKHPDGGQQLAQRHMPLHLAQHHGDKEHFHHGSPGGGYRQ